MSLIIHEVNTGNVTISATLQTFCLTFFNILFMFKVLHQILHQAFFQYPDTLAQSDTFVNHLFLCLRIEQEAY